MPADLSLNEYIFQIRFRIRRHEKRFRQTIEQAYSDLDQGGLLSTFRQTILRRLIDDFDETIGEIIEYAKDNFEHIDDELDQLVSTTANELNNSARAFKGILDPDYVLSRDHGDDTPGRIQEALEELDQLLVIRMQDFKRWTTRSTRSQAAPASNRYVSFADNQQRTAVEADLTELKQAVEASNEPSEEERLIALSEIAAFEATIIQARISSDLIQRFVDRVITWLVRLFPAALVSNAADRLVAALLTLIKSSGG